MSLRMIFILCLALASLSCSGNSAQDAFEAQSRKLPQGITQTDNVGRIISTDPDDWRTGPMFSGYIDVTVPAYPNPTRGERITIDILISGLESVNRLQVYTRTSVGTPLFLFENADSPIQVGLTQIVIDASSFSELQTYQSAIGLHRVFIYDQRGNLITYGDVRID